MKTIKSKLATLIPVALLALSTILYQPTTLFAQGTAFTYQGRLTSGTNAANGNYDFQFYLRDALAPPGNPVGTTNTVAPVAVSNGLFTVKLDFGAGIFTGPALWLEIGVRTNGSSAAYATLAPRQQLTPAPYAIYSENAGLATTADGVINGAVSAPQLNTLGAPGSGQVLGFNGSGLVWTTPSAGSGGWALGGNSGTTLANFLGTTDNQRLELAVNNAPALRLVPTADTPQVIGGASVNTVAAGIHGATIAGGGSIAIYGAPYPNQIFATHGTIGGGLGNTIRTNAYESTIAGGNQNFIDASANRSVIGGGFQNSCGLNAAFVGGGTINHANGSSSTIGGGYDNTVSANAATISGGARNRVSGDLSAIGGGDSNAADGGYATVPGGNGNSASANFSTVGGGHLNTGSLSCTVAGGEYNTTSRFADAIGGGYANSAQGDYATISGGAYNTNSGLHATVGGGYGNLAFGPDSATVGGGYLNVASNYAATVSGGQNNQALGLHAVVGGGFFNKAIGDNATVSGGINNGVVGVAGVVPGGTLNSVNGDYSFAAGRRAKANYQGSFVWADSQNVDFTPGGLGFALQDFVAFRCAGGVLFTSDSGGASQSVSWVPGQGSWNFASDRNLKDRLQAVDTQAVLDKVSRLSISEWSYKEYPQRHIGAMAQDFHALFPLNDNDKMLNDADLHGVALAAIQGLNQKVNEKEARIQELEQRLEKLEQRMNHENEGAK